MARRTRKEKHADSIKEQIIVQQLGDDSIPNDVLEKLFTGVRFHVNDKGCWIRGNDSTLYTTIKYKGKQEKAHRLSFELFKGRPISHCGCHTCDVPACINPDHIVDGTQGFNVKDGRSKGRIKDPIPKDPLKGIRHNRIDYYRETKPDFVEKLL